ncbi:MAG: glycosyltransferase family 4 protein [Actinobacteria bacterium]|nr:glycosyltransferase family 4 protein [Actinomycetota bacterium]
MHVALNAVHLVLGETGGLEIYARRLITALEESDPSLRLTVYAGPQAVRELRREGWRADLAAVQVDARTRSRAVLAEQTILRGLLRQSSPDLLHNLFNTAPALPGIPQVTTIHDLIYRRVPKTHAGLLGLGLRVLVPLAARRSRRVIAVSEATKADVVRYLGIAPERVDVAQNGPGSPPSADPTPESILRSQLGLGEGPVLLSLSAKRPHKNLERLIEAMPSIDATLVLPGYPTPFEGDLRALVGRLGIADRIRFAGWLEEADVEGLYALAACVVVPSLVEGFGFPALEAMLRGTPVTCSAIPALQEVAGDAAVFFDPFDPLSIARAVNQVLADEELGSRLQAAGKKRAARFTWESAAAATRASYERALTGSLAGGAGIR